MQQPAGTRPPRRRAHLSRQAHRRAWRGRARGRDRGGIPGPAGHGHRPCGPRPGRSRQQDAAPADDPAVPQGYRRTARLPVADGQRCNVRLPLPATGRLVPSPCAIPADLHQG